MNFPISDIGMKKRTPPKSQKLLSAFTHLPTSHLPTSKPCSNCPKCPKPMNINTVIKEFDNTIIPIINNILSKRIDEPSIKTIMSSYAGKSKEYKSREEYVISYLSKGPFIKSIKKILDEVGKCTESNNWDEENTFWGGESPMYLKNDIEPNSGFTTSRIISPTPIFNVKPKQAPISQNFDIEPNSGFTTGSAASSNVKPTSSAASSNVKPTSGYDTPTSQNFKKNFNVKPSVGVKPNGYGTPTSQNFNVKPFRVPRTLASQKFYVNCKCKTCIKDVNFTNMQIMFNSIINPLLNDILKDDGVMIVDIPLVSMLQDNTAIMVDHIKSLAKSMVQIQNKLPCPVANNSGESENSYWGGSKRSTRKLAMKKRRKSLRRRRF